MAVDAEDAGMDAFMDKPFKLEDLTAVYIKILERDQRHSNHQSTVTPSIVDVSSLLGVVVRAHRSIRNVTPNAKIFIDASELDYMVPALIGGNSSLLEQDGTSPTVAVAVPERKVATMADKPATCHVQPPTECVSVNSMINGITQNAKVHVAN